MVSSDTQASTASTASVQDGGQVYAMSAEGKRQAYILLAGVASIWIFAVWTAITILQDGITGVEWVSLLLMLGMIVVAPVVAWTLLEEANSRLQASTEGIRYMSMGGIDLNYTWSELSGLKPTGRGRVARFFLGEDDEQNAHINNGVSNVEAGVLRQGENRNDGTGGNGGTDGVSEDADEPFTEGNSNDDPDTLLIQVPDKTAQIANPLVRFLHNQAHGSALPVYGKLENRAELINSLARHVPSVAAALGGPAADRVPLSQSPSISTPPPTE